MTSKELIQVLKHMLQHQYGEMKFGNWGRQLEFDAVRDLDQGTTKVTAVKYIEGLRVSS